MPSESRDESLLEHRAALARELLDDIELSRIPLRRLLLKVARLARLEGDADMRDWVSRELAGFENSEEGRKYMSWSGRWTDFGQLHGYWQSSPQLKMRARALRWQLALLRLPDVTYAPSSANPHERVTGFAWQDPVEKALNTVLENQRGVARELGDLEGIRGRVLHICHGFTTRAYYALEFGARADSLFENYKREVDALLKGHAPEALERLPAIYDRLREGDAEAISQAMNSCRRVVSAFADAVYPPGEGTVTVDGQPYAIGAEAVLNRAKLFLRKHCTSSTRAERLNKNLRQIWERASAGAHADVTTDEARALVLQAYLTIGEMLTAARAGGWTGELMPPPEAGSGTGTGEGGREPEGPSGIVSA